MAMLQLDDGGALYYEQIDGKPGLPCLVFLHEGLGCTAMWRDFPARLCAASGCSGLVYDRRGYGQSSPPPAPRSIHYLHESALLELPVVLHAVLGERPYLLIGHSDGGSIALIAAAGQAPGLRAVVTMAAHVFVEQVTLDGIHAALDAHGAGRLRALERYHGAKSQRVFNDWADTWLMPSFSFWNIEYLLPSVRCPVLALQGADDQYGSLAQLDSIAGKCPQGQQLVLDDCGHSPHLEQSERVVQALLAFVGQHGA
jgi:pimeloyl-ACP methyl ester carboxylesterase